MKTYRRLLLALLFVVMMATACLGIIHIDTIYTIDDIVTYQQQLADINDIYLGEFESRVIVKTTREISDENSIAFASGFAGLNILQYRTKQEAEDAVKYYSSLKYVEYAQVDFEITTQEIYQYESAYPVPDYSDINSLNHLSWGADLLGVDVFQQAIYMKYEGDLPVVYVAVLDTGIDTDNEFLQGRIAYDLGISFYDSELYLDGQSKYKFEDDNSHGTHVSGTITDLTLDNVKIIPIKVLNGEGSGSLSNILSGMEYVLWLKENDTNVVAFNMSLGGYGYSKEYNETINLLYDKNVLAIVAAGNENYYVEEFQPANCEKALTISALSQNEYYEKFPYIAYYSNYGSLIDLCAPGSKILSCVPDECTYDEIYSSETGGRYAVISGTSMATPHITGLVALYATYYGSEYNVEQVEKEIKSNTYDWGDPGRDDQYGYGVPTMVFALEDKELTSEPLLNYGKVNGTYNFDSDSIDVIINNTNPNYAGLLYKIYYSLDGSMPTMVCYDEYSGDITLNNSALLRFVIYLFDNEGQVHGHSQIYEVTYYKGALTANSDGTGFEITSYGWIKSYTSGLKDVVIPEYINGIKVKYLASNLFYGLNIESVKCESDVDIFYPFVSCPSLKSIELHSSKADWIAEYCFGLKEVILPNISELGSLAIGECYNLERIVAPKVSEIKSWAFQGCKKLKEIEIDWTSLTAIGNWALANCESLQKEDFNLSNLESLGEYAFYSTNVKSITLSEKIKDIPEKSFSFCRNLQYINLEHIETIGDGAFEFCSNLETVDVSGVKSMGEEAFSFSGITYVDLTALSTLGAEAFDYCWNLKVVLLGSNEYLISQSVAWLSNYYTRVLLIDKEYDGPIGTFLTENYSYRYDEFENYPYVLLASRQIVTATFQFADGTVICTDYYLPGDSVMPPTTFSYLKHTYKLLNWTSQWGTLLQEKDFDSIYGNKVYVLKDFEIITAMHTSSDWIVTKESTCDEVGSRHTICKVCSEELEVEEIPAIEHNIEHHNAKSATCTEVGWNAYDKCLICDYTTFIEIPAMGHLYGEWDTVIKADCTLKGLEERICAYDETHKETREIIAYGHDLVHYEAQAPTCTEIGWNAYDTCKRCDYSTYDEILATGHTSCEWIITKEATIDESGERHKICLTCGEELESEVILKINDNSENIIKNNSKTVLLLIISFSIGFLLSGVIFIAVWVIRMKFIK